MRQQYTWNPMYNKIIQIKDQFMQLQLNKSIYDMPFKNICELVHEQKLTTDVNFTELYTDTYALLLVKYSMYSHETDLYTNPQSILREARSLVIDLKSEDIVLCPFRKFFNLNEVAETSLQYITSLLAQPHTLEVSNKLDGSMQSIRYWNGSFIMSGSSALDINKSPQLLHGWQILNSNIHLQEMIKAYPEYTFIFEAILEDDKHVVTYTGNDLYLIGIRNVYTGEELDYNRVTHTANMYHIPTTTLDATTLQQLLYDKQKYKAYEKEGWVIRIKSDKADIRIKLKCDEYLKAHKLANITTSPNAVLESLVDNTLDDNISYMSDDDKNQVKRIRDMILKIVAFKEALITYYYMRFAHIKSDKDFAIAINTHVPRSLRQFMFNKRKNISYDLFHVQPAQQASAIIRFTHLTKFIQEYKDDWEYYDRYGCIKE